MSFDSNSWMSCRPVSRSAAGNRGDISLLPQFAVPPGVTAFSLETRPPTLPSRNSPTRVVSLCLVSVLCLFGSLTIISAVAEPTMRHGRSLVGGMAVAVSTAIDHANSAAELRAQEHYAAREEYFMRRGLRDGGSLSTRRMNELSEPRASVEKLPVPRGRSSLLIRMAALRRLENPTGDIDEEAVAAYFPEWVASESTAAGEWKNEAVLKDVVLAVSQLAHRASIEN